MLKGIFCRYFIVVVSLILIVGCGERPMCFTSIEGAMLGTRYHITAEIPTGAEADIAERAEMLDRRMKREMSIFDPTSQLSLINSGVSDETTPWIEANINLADSISRLSGGVYDITVAPLVKAWGFAGGRTTVNVVPNIDSLLEFVGYRGIKIEDGHIAKQDPRMQIDLNSIAKGFAVDRMADILESMGVVNYMVDIGGELRLGGVNPRGSAWRIGVETPIDGNMTDGEFLQQRIAVDTSTSLRAVATSGNYRRFYLMPNGEKVVHTINPMTGYAESSTLLSVTVLARSCAEADAMATMLMAAGDKRAEELAQEIENCEVYLIYNSAEEEGGYRVYASDGMSTRLLDGNGLK